MDETKSSMAGRDRVLNISHMFSTNTVRPTADRQLLYMLVQVAPNQVQAVTKIPLNICLVLDRSSSMRGEKMARVKEAARYIVDQLSPTDTFSVVSFNDRASVVVRSQRVQARDQIKNMIDSIEARGGTEMASGISMGLDEINSAYAPNLINYMLLLTDGQTYGDEDECVRLARLAAEKKIVISPLGLGDEWNEDLLETIAARTGSSSEYIDTPEKISAAFKNKVEGFRSIYARNATVALYLEQGTQLQKLYRVTPLISELKFSEPKAVAQVLGQAALEAGAAEEVRLERERDEQAERDRQIVLARQQAEQTAQAASDPGASNAQRAGRSLLGVRISSVVNQPEAQQAANNTGGDLRNLFNQPLPPALPRAVNGPTEQGERPTMIGEGEARAGKEQEQQRMIVQEQERDVERSNTLALLTPNREALLTSINLGHLRADEEQFFLAEVLIAPQAPGQRRLGRLCLVYDLPSMEGEPQAVADEMTLTYSLEVKPPYPVSAVIKSVVERLIAFKLQGRAWQDLKAGDVRQATMKLKMVATHLLNAGDKDLAETVQREIEHLEGFGQASRSGTKKIKYGTRGLVASAGTAKLFQGMKLNTTNISR